MKLGKELDISRLLPSFMREDKNFNGIAYALEQEFKRIHNDLETIKIYLNMDKLSEAVLDELAYMFNIPEYDLSYNVDIKRSLIKGCLATHHKRGTVAAVEEVVTKVFGIAEVEEWFDYDGEPYHFRIRTTNLQSTDEMVAEVERLVLKVQNVRSHLDEVIIETSQTMGLYYGTMVDIGEFINLKTI